MKDFLSDLNVKLNGKMRILEEYKSNDVKESFVDAYLDTLPIVLIFELKL